MKLPEVDVMLKQVDFLDLQVLQSLMRTHGVAITAQHLGLSIPGTSRRLGLLRQVFEDELFVRSGHEMLPTNRMRELDRKICAILDTAKGLTDAAEAFDLRRETRTIRVISSDNVAAGLVAPSLRSLMTQAPKAGVQIANVDDQVLERLRYGQADMAILGQTQGLSSDFFSLELYESPYYVMCRTSHPLAKHFESGEALTMAALSAFRSVRIANTKNSLQSPEPLSVNVGFETPYFMNVPDVLRETDMVYVGSLITLNWLHSRLGEDLTLLPAPDSLGLFTPHLVWHQSTHQDPFLQWARGLLTHVSRQEAKRWNALP